MEKQTKSYQKPFVEVIPWVSEEVLCTSTADNSVNDLVVDTTVLDGMFN